MSQFVDDIAVQRCGDNTWSANMSSRWNSSSSPNGGYLMATAARALSEALPHKDPLTITGYYLNKSINGPAELPVEVIREGRSISTGQVSLIQNGEEKVRFLASYTDFAKLKGESFCDEPMPDFPPPDACGYDHKMPVAINEMVDIRFIPKHSGWTKGDLLGRSEMMGWIKLHDSDQADFFSLILFADAFPPPVFNRVGVRGWVPTIDLNIQLRQLPAAGYIACRYRSRFVTKGILETDVELWDSNKDLVALARQTAKLRLPR